MDMENARIDNAARSTQAFAGAKIDGLCESYDPALIAILACRRDLNRNSLYELGEDGIIRPGKSNTPVYAHPWIFGRNLEIINYCCAALGVRTDEYNGYNRDVILWRTGGRIDIENEPDQDTIRELTEYYIKLSTQQIRSAVQPNVQLVTMVGANTSCPITANEFGMQAAKIAGQLPGNCSLREIVDYDSLAVDPVRGILTRQESCVEVDKSEIPHKYSFGNAAFSPNCPGCPLFPAGCAIANEVKYPSSDWQGRVSEGSWRDVWSNVSEYVENPARMRRPFFVRMAAGLVNRFGVRG